VEKLNRWKKEFEREPVSIEGQVSSSNSGKFRWSFIEKMLTQVRPPAECSTKPAKEYI